MKAHMHAMIYWLAIAGLIFFATLLFMGGLYLGRGHHIWSGVFYLAVASALYTLASEGIRAKL